MKRPLFAYQQHFEPVHGKPRLPEILDHHQLDPLIPQLLACCQCLGHIADLPLGQLFQLQQIGGQHIGAGQRPVFEKVGDSGCHYAPLVGVTHDGITEIEGVRVERFESGHRRQYLFPLLGRAEVTA